LCEFTIEAKPPRTIRQAQTVEMFGKLKKKKPRTACTIKRIPVFD